MGTGFVALVATDPFPVTCSVEVHTLGGTDNLDLHADAGRAQDSSSVRSVRFCPAGHDTFETGRDKSNRRCSECRRQKQRDYSKQYMSKPENKAKRRANRKSAAKPMEFLKCEHCAGTFLRAKTGKAARWCSDKCRYLAGYDAKGRTKMSDEERAERLRRYRARPEVRARINALSRQRYNTDEYREYSRERQRKIWADPEKREKLLARQRVKAVPDIADPYTGHKWLQMARDSALGDNQFFDSAAPWADDKHDEMGEALLALLEGRDPDEAVREYRKQEYVSRHLTLRLGDWRDDEDQQRQWFESVMPQAESAEDEVMAGESVKFYAQTRFKNVHNKNRTLNHKTQQPRRRRMKDAGWRKYAT